MVASREPPTGDPARHPGLCPDWEQNWRPLGLQAGAQSLSHTSQGHTHSYVSKVLIDAAPFSSIKALAIYMTTQPFPHDLHQYFLLSIKFFFYQPDVQIMVSDFFLLFKYSCLHFPATTLPCCTHPYLPPSVLPIISVFKKILFT